MYKYFSMNKTILFSLLLLFFLSGTIISIYKVKKILNNYFAQLKNI